MTVTTGPAISGTQSAEDDPSTPLAKPLGMLTRKINKILKLSKRIRKKKNGSTTNRTY